LFQGHQFRVTQRILSSLPSISSISDAAPPSIEYNREDGHLTLFSQLEGAAKQPPHPEQTL